MILDAFGHVEATYPADVLRAQRDVDITCQLPETTSCASCGQETGDRIYRFPEVANIDQPKPSRMLFSPCRAMPYI